MKNFTQVAFFKLFSAKKIFFLFRIFIYKKLINLFNYLCLCLLLDLSARNNQNYIQSNNLEDSKRDDFFLDEELNKAKGINKAIDILLANDDDF